MSKSSIEPKTGKRKWLEDRTYQEDPDESEADALRESGLDWLPFNGTVPEVSE